MAFDGLTRGANSIPRSSIETGSFPKSGCSLTFQSLGDSLLHSLFRRLAQLNSNKGSINGKLNGRYRIDPWWELHHFFLSIYAMILAKGSLGCLHWVEVRQYLDPPPCQARTRKCVAAVGVGTFNIALHGSMVGRTTMRLDNLLGNNKQTSYSLSKWPHLFSLLHNRRYRSLI
jgi:hypothetical protein